MEILSQEQEQNQVKEPIRGTVRGDAAKSVQLLLVANVEAFTRANMWPGSKQEKSENSDTAPAGKRSLETRVDAPTLYLASGPEKEGIGVER